LSAITVSGGEAPPLNLSIQFIELLKPLTLTRSRFFFKRLQEEVIGCAVTNVCRTLRIRACRQATRAPHVTRRADRRANSAGSTLADISAPRLGVRFDRAESEPISAFAV